MGMPWFYCIKRHLFPRLLPMVATLTAFSIGNAILALATLGFVSVGLRPPTAELGLMMTELFPYHYQAPLIFLQPVIAVFLLVFSLQLLAGKVK
ncbi:binding--dependent transport system inner membrane component family protein [Glaesserella parasuis MN-H]|nr:binding--dependent transport system inner membrane component family protein [Glaesserella parasuis MN-H]